MIYITHIIYKIHILRWFFKSIKKLIKYFCSFSTYKITKTILPKANEIIFITSFFYIEKMANKYYQKTKGLQKDTYEKYQNFS